MKTESLIHTLASNAGPVRPLSHPVWRCVYWFVLALLFVFLGVLGIGFRSDVFALLLRVDFLSQIASLLFIALTTTAAAFFLGVPERRRGHFYVLPMIAVLGGFFVFILPIAHEWGGHVGIGTKCLINVLILSVPPVAVTCFMLMRAFPLGGKAAGLFAFLGASALGCLGTRFICPNDSPSHFFIWHCVPIAVFAAAGLVLGHSFLRKNL